MGMTIDDFYWSKKYEKLLSDYKTRLKADMVAMLTELQLEIEELDTPSNGDAYMTCSDIIQQKINALKAETEDQDGTLNN